MTSVTADSSFSRSKLLVPLALALAMVSLSGCSLFKKDDDDAPKRKEYHYRDPTEQRVFYDGWGQR